MTIQDWSGQRASNIASVICGFLTVLAGTVVLHSTREPDQTASAGRFLFNLVELLQWFSPNYYLNFSVYYCRPICRTSPKNILAHPRKWWYWETKRGWLPYMWIHHCCAARLLCVGIIQDACLVFHVFFLSLSAAACGQNPLQDPFQSNTSLKQLWSFVEIVLACVQRIASELVAKIFALWTT